MIRVIKSRRAKWTGYVARMGKMRIEYKILVGKVESKRPFGILARIGDDNIKMYLKGTVCMCVVMDWIHISHNSMEW
jgi:hypothetical protein